MNRSATALAVLLAASSALAAVGCSARRTEPISGPLPHDDAIARGHVVFDRHCDRCHSGGEGGLGPSLNDKWVPAAAIRFQVRAGLGAMPCFPPEKLPDDQLEDAICYLIALRHR